MIIINVCISQEFLAKNKIFYLFLNDCSQNKRLHYEREFLIITSNEFRKIGFLSKEKVVGRFTNQLLGHSLTYYG